MRSVGTNTSAKGGKQPSYLYTDTATTVQAITTTELGSGTVFACHLDYPMPQ